MLAELKSIFICNRKSSNRTSRKTSATPAPSPAYVQVSDTDALRTIPAGGTDPVSDVGENLFGVHGEIAYNVIYYVDTPMELLPFVRLDYFDTTFNESDRLSSSQQAASATDRSDRSSSSSTTRRCSPPRAPTKTDGTSISAGCSYDDDGRCFGRRGFMLVDR